MDNISRILYYPCQNKVSCPTSFDHARRERMLGHKRKLLGHVPGCAGAWLRHCLGGLGTGLEKPDVDTSKRIPIGSLIHVDLSNNHKLNLPWQKNYTPLLVACEYQKLEVVRYLLQEIPGIDASAYAEEKDPKTGNVGSKTGLHLAAIHDSPEIAQELIAKQCPLDVQDCVVGQS